MSLRRALQLMAWGTLALCLLGLFAGWIVFSRWVPTQGKAWLIQELERPGLLRVSIGTLHYAPLRGFSLTDVVLAERATEERWVHLSTVQARVGWLSAFLRRQIVFRAHADVAHPATTSLTLTGRYPLRERSLSLEVSTEDISIRSIQPPLRRTLPPSLSDGTLRLNARLRKPAQGAAVIAGQMVGTALTYAVPPGRFTGDVLIDGTLTQPMPPATRWSLEGAATLRHGTVEGLPMVGALTALQGQAKIRTDRIEFEELTYEMLGSPWRAEGTLQLNPSSVEGLVTSHVDVAALTSALPLLPSEWRPEGHTDVRLVCRGPLQPSVLLDCLATAHLREVAVSGKRLAHPLTNVSGRLHYDALARLVTVDQVQGRIARQPLSLDGTVRLVAPLQLGVRLAGRLPLDLVEPWLATPAAMSALGGTASVDLQVIGPHDAAQLAGRMELQDATARLTAAQATIDQAHATLTFSPNRLTITDASLRWNEYPMNVRATISPARQASLLQWLNDAMFDAGVGLPYGRVEVTGRLQPETVTVDTGRLTLAHSDVAFKAAISRQPDGPSRVMGSGTVDLEDLPSLPLPALATLKPWPLQGRIDVEAQGEGATARWQQATLEARLRANRITVQGVPIEQLIGTLERRRDTLRIQVPSSTVGGGKFWGELSITESPNAAFQLQADAIGVQLDQLAQAIPAWRKRSVVGTASGQIAVSGQWADRATWQGQGWINASGERLGDVPLLDRLFQHALLGPLAEWLRWDLLRRAEITRASMRWQLADARGRSDDLRLAGVVRNVPVVGNAGVVLYVQGSMGLDHTLDLTVRPELSEQIISQSQVLNSAASVIKAAGLLNIVRYRVTGTLKEPKSRFETTPQELLKQLLQWSPGDLLENLLGPSSRE